MTPLRFWFDPISPFAYLAFERLPRALTGLSVSVEYRPILFAGLLKHWGQLGPAEIEPKRAWTYRQVQWLGRDLAAPLQLPAAHPFNPLPLLRLLTACDEHGRPNRRQCEAVLRHVWSGGAAADDAARLQALAAALAPRRDPQSDAVKQQLRAATDEAVALGVFGVPTLELPAAQAGQAPRLFWGADALDMAAACLRGEPWFEREWDRAGERPGTQRRSAQA